MNFAVIKTGGKQYHVAVGDVVTVEKLPAAPVGAKIDFPEVLLMAGDEETIVGAPYVAGAKVAAEVVAVGRGKKITVIKFKPKVRYRKKLGHRQPFTKIKITKIG